MTFHSRKALTSHDFSFKKSTYLPWLFIPKKHLPPKTFHSKKALTSHDSSLKKALTSKKAPNYDSLPPMTFNSKKSTYLPWLFIPKKTLTSHDFSFQKSTYLPWLFIPKKHLPPMTFHSKKALTSHDFSFQKKHLPPMTFHSKKSTYLPWLFIPKKALTSHDFSFQKSTYLPWPFIPKKHLPPMGILDSSRVALLSLSFFYYLYYGRRNLLYIFWKVIKLPFQILNKIQKQNHVKKIQIDWTRTKISIWTKNK